jgi:hypothetical protein
MSIEFCEMGLRGGTTTTQPDNIPLGDRGVIDSTKCDFAHHFGRYFQDLPLLRLNVNSE